MSIARLDRYKELALPLAGILLSFSFAPYHYGLLALPTLLWVFYCWLDCSAIRAAWRGYLFGLGVFGAGINWVYISIHDYGGAPVIGACLLTLLVICFWSLFPALTGFLAVRMAGRRYRSYLLWIIPLVWILVEYYRGYWFLNGFPWLQIAYTQLGLPLQGFIPLVGVYGEGFLLAISVSLLLSGLLGKLLARYVFIGFIILWGGGAALNTIQWTAPIGEPLRVALIQGNVAQDQKWQPENRVKTLLDYRQMTQQHWGADLIIWPETAIPAYWSQVKDLYLQPLAIEARQHQTELIVSLPSRNQANQHFNTVLALGDYTGQYHKNHLLPFGEYLPWQPVSGFILDLLGIQLGSFTSGGDQQALLQVAGYSFATSICYEDAFGSEAIKAMPAANFLVNVTNDAWFGDSIEPAQHLQIAQMRSLETGRYLLRATNTGITAIVKPDGSILKQAPTFRQTVLTGHILPMGGLTPYARLGDHWVIALLVVLFLLLGLIGKL